MKKTFEENQQSCNNDFVKSELSNSDKKISLNDCNNDVCIETEDITVNTNVEKENTDIITFSESKNITLINSFFTRFIRKILSNKKMLILVAGVIIILMLIVLFSTHVICFHNWQQATCTLPKTCSICKKTEGKATGHKKGDWETTKTATLSQYGTKQQKCIICNEIIDTANIVKTAEITSTGFNFTEEELIEFINDSLSSSYSVSTEPIDEEMYPVYKNSKFCDVLLKFVKDKNGYVSKIGVVATNANTGVAIMIFIANELFNGFFDTDNDALIGTFFVNKKYSSKGVTVSYAKDSSMIIVLLEPSKLS